jgi:hypothetical protein
MTVDMGFNNVQPCLRHQHIDDPCVDQALDVVRVQLARILSVLHSAGHPGMRIIGVGHYDPYLGDYFDGPAGRAFATSSVQVISELNQTLRAIYAHAGVPMVDVAGAFDMTSTAPTELAGVGTIPRNVERVCALTWMCRPPPLGPNPHPNDDGYRAVSRAIAALVTAH